MKLTKTAYNKLVKAKILQTGLYNGRSVEEAEDDDALYEYLKSIELDYRTDSFTTANVDAQIARNFLKYENVYNSNDFDIYLDNDDYLNDLKLFLGSKY